MNRTVNSVEVFHQYAEDRLKEHMPLQDEKRKALNDHFQHCREELKEQVKNLSKGNPQAEKQLRDLYEVYETKIRNNKSQ